MDETNVTLFSSTGAAQDQRCLLKFYVRRYEDENPLNEIFYSDFVEAVKPQGPPVSSSRRKFLRRACTPQGEP